MEIKDFSALQLALNACTGISALATASNDPQSKAKLLNSLTAVKEVLDILENGQRNQSVDVAYAMLYDAYQKSLNAVNDNFESETKN